MVKRLESSIQSAVVHWALYHKGVESRKLEAAAGDPDVLFLVPYHPLLIEFKRGRATPKDLQNIVHTRWRAQGYDVQYHDDVDRAKAAILAALATPLWGPSLQENVGVTVGGLRAKLLQPKAAIPVCAEVEAAYRHIQATRGGA